MAEGVRRIVDGPSPGLIARKRPDPYGTGEKDTTAIHLAAARTPGIDCVLASRSLRPPLGGELFQSRN